MWRELLDSLTNEVEYDNPVAESEIPHAEGELGLSFPESLRDVLRTSNGIKGKYGLSLLWSLEGIVEQNVKFRETESFKDLYMPFDYLLFFADAGNGDQFAFSIAADGLIHRPDVYAWNHEDDSRNWVAPSLRHYFEWWLSGRIKL